MSPTRAPPDGRERLPADEPHGVRHDEVMHTCRVSASTDEQSSAAVDDAGAAGPRPWFVRHAVVIAVVLVGVLLALVGVGVALVGRRAPVAPTDSASTSGPVRATGIPDSVPTSIAYLMGLSPVPSAPAPSFTLVDQAGHTVSLASLRGHPVVLEFMDPHCVDICPIVSQEFVDAYREMGASAKGVIFLGVNVNPFHTDVASVATYSTAHGLAAVSTWHFLTGPASALRPVWKDYDVTVSAPTPDADVVHTSIIYFIDPSGHERYVAFPMADHKADGSSYLPPDQTAAWGRGIALVAQSLR